MAGDGAAILLCDKPAGITSHDLVDEVRRERRLKTGHAGTLDPFATGLMVILLGRATRLQRYLMGLAKTYVAVAHLGWRSTTGDPDGELRETGLIPDDLTLPTGSVMQRLPMTSAVRVDGERLYRKAHRGETIETPEREVFVHRAELLQADGDRALFEIECSAGTYVRTLIETLDDAYCSELRRTAVGPLSIDDVGRELTSAQALSFMPGRELDSEEARFVACGRPVPSRAPGEDGDDQTAQSGGDGPVRLTHEGELLAVARPDGDMLRCEVVLA